MAMTSVLYSDAIYSLVTAGLDFSSTSVTWRMSLYTADYDGSGGLNYYENQGDAMGLADPIFYGGVELTGLNLVQDTDEVRLEAADVTFPGVDGTPKYAVFFVDLDSSHLNSPMLGHIDLDQSITYNTEDFTLSFPDGLLVVKNAS